MRRPLALLLGLLLLVVPFDMVLSVGIHTLPNSLFWRGGCAIGVGLDATLHGSPTDPQVTWATDNWSGTRMELLWPVGYSAGFDPGLELFDAGGRVVGHEGDLIIGTCTMGSWGDLFHRVEANDIRPPSWRPGDG